MTNNVPDASEKLFPFSTYEQIVFLVIDKKNANSMYISAVYLTKYLFKLYIYILFFMLKAHFTDTRRSLSKPGFK